VIHKHIIFWAMVALAGFGCQTTSTTHHDHVEMGTGVAEAMLKDTTPIDGPSVTLVVHGMSCPLCSNNLGKTLMEMPGVEGVMVNLDTGKVVVTTPGPIKPTRSALAGAVKNSGFKLIRLEEAP